MKFQNMTTSREIAEAIKLADILLLPYTGLFESVKAKDDWKFDSVRIGMDVAWSLCVSKRPSIPVFTYKPFNPFTKAIGYFDGKSIHINSRKLPFMTTVEIAANLIHEYAHYCGYTHGSNWKTEEKCLYSVPYFLSENISKWL